MIIYDQRYLVYCSENDHAEDPEAMKAEDHKKYPDGYMTGYFFWVREKWIQYMREYPDELVMEQTHGGRFNKWLGISSSNAKE